MKLEEKEIYNQGFQYQKYYVDEGGFRQGEYVAFYFGNKLARKLKYKNGELFGICLFMEDKFNTISSYNKIKHGTEIKLK